MASEGRKEHGSWVCPHPVRTAGHKVQLGTCKLLLPVGGVFLKFLALGLGWEHDLSYPQRVLGLNCGFGGPAGQAWRFLSSCSQCLRGH